MAMAPPSTQKTRFQTSGASQQTPSMLADYLGELSIKSKLDEFRLFFDLKSGPWDSLRGQLNTYVQSLYSWADLRDDEVRRRLCAMEFLDEVGMKYWGEENREKNLVEERLKRNDACRFPQDKKPMTDALVLLLEKSSKARRTSIAQDVPGFRHDELNAAGPAISNQTPEPTLNANQRLSLTASPEAIKTSSITLEGTIGRLLAPRRIVTENQRDMITQSRSLKHGPTSALGQNNAPPSTEIAQRQRKLPGSNMLATYFLVTSSESGNPREPVCIPFEFYRDADDFLDKMEDKFGDETSRQICNEMPSLSRQYAVVRLNWSGVSFVIRRGTQDLQALDYRVFCAWNAKDDGELAMIEFEISVTLKPEI